MAAYATYTDVEAGFRDLNENEQTLATQLLEEAALIIDAYVVSADVTNDIKKLVSCRMVRRAIGSEDSMQSIPLGATQGSASAMGYTQSWTMASGTGGSGELFISKTEKKLLKIGNSIGSRSPLESMVIVND